jgi:hypothetical protein
MTRKKSNPAPLVPPPVPKLTEPADDPDLILAFLNAERSATEWALAMYARGPRNEPIVLGVGGQTSTAGPLHDMLFTRGLALRRVERAARAVETHDFGPRAPLADVQQRVRRVERAVGNIQIWALQFRGRQPPPWEWPPDTASPEEVWEAMARLPDCRSPEARPENEREELWKELEEARAELLLLRSLKPAGEVNWSRPDRVAGWAKIFGVSERTMSTRLKTQQVRNQKITRRSYRIALDQIPSDQRERFPPAE